MQRLWSIFVRFFRIGAFTIGGGIVMLGVIESEVRAITVIEQMRAGVEYPHVQAYLQRLAGLDSWKRALKLENSPQA